MICSYFSSHAILLPVLIFLTRGCVELSNLRGAILAIYYFEDSLSLSPSMSVCMCGYVWVVWVYIRHTTMMIAGLVDYRVSYLSTMDHLRKIS